MEHIENPQPVKIKRQRHSDLVPSIPAFSLTNYQTECIKRSLDFFNQCHPQQSLRSDNDVRVNCAMRRFGEACYGRISGNYSTTNAKGETAARDRGCVLCTSCRVALHRDCFVSWHQAMFGLPQLQFPPLAPPESLDDATI